MALTLAEEVLLLALDEKGSAGGMHTDVGLAGALVVDLGRLGALEAPDQVVHPVEHARVDHPVLARAHAVIVASRKPRPVKAWIQLLPSRLKPLTATVAGPLVQRGILTAKRVRVFGLFPSTRFFATDPGPELELRARLRSILLGERAPEEQDALLLGLLLPVGLVDQLVERAQRREARARAKEIAESGLAGGAVSDAVREVQAAVVAAAGVAALGAAGAGGGG